MINPTDVARLSHRFQVILLNTATSELLAAARIQRYEPAVQTNNELFNELGSVDPVGSATDAPTFRIGFEEHVHASDLDLLLAGKVVSSGAAWTLADYINGGNITSFLLERTNDVATTIAGEMQFSQCVLTEINWSWRVGQAITASYTLLGRLGQHFKAASAVHAWQAYDTTSPGGIKAKDARLFLGGAAAGNRVYRLQGFDVRVTFPDTVISEIGARQIAGVLTSPPQTRVNLDFALADAQPDDALYTTVSSNYYDYTQPLALTGSVIRIYDPAGTEGTTVLRAWKLETLLPGNASPATVNVKGIANKRYEFVVNKATTPGSGGVLLYKGDVV